jgi:hypothetical protein
VYHRRLHRKKINRVAWQSPNEVYRDEQGLERQGLVKYEKGFMDLESAKRAYHRVNTLPHVCHFRKSSCSGVTPALTHPFIVSAESPIELEYSGNDPILVHNGVIGNWRDMFRNYCIAIGRIPEGELSDTRVMAMMTDRLGEAIFEWYSDKFVLMSWDDIQIFGSFVEQDGIKFSNNTYKSFGVTRQTYQSLRYDGFYEDPDDDGEHDDDDVPLDEDITQTDMLFKEIDKKAKKRNAVAKASKKGKNQSIIGRLKTAKESETFKNKKNDYLNEFWGQ